MPLLKKCINCGTRGRYLGDKSTYCAVCLVEEGYVVYDDDYNALVVASFPQEEE